MDVHCPSTAFGVLIINACIIALVFATPGIGLTADDITPTTPPRLFVSKVITISDASAGKDISL
jgi:hypothetical protein